MNYLTLSCTVKTALFVSLFCKRGCVFPMVIWPESRTGQYSVNDHPYHAPQFMLSKMNLVSRLAADWQQRKYLTYSDF